MKIKTLVAGMCLASAPVMAAADTMPAICNSVANYAIQALDLTFSDGKWTDPYDPNSVVLNKDLVTFPMTVKTLGNCDDGVSKLKDSWCAVAGGSPTVYEADVARVNGNYSFPYATVIVTYNRGGCWVDESARL